MRLQLEADADELRERGSELVQALAHQLQHDAPELAEALHKSVGHPIRPMPQKALRDLQKELLAGYQDAMQEAMDQVVRLFEGQGDV